jgi:hypothetical protein
MAAAPTTRGRSASATGSCSSISSPPAAGVEELHLLQGELWIDDRKLVPGDYNRAEPGTSDARVFSQTGCTCVLITSPNDRLS